MGRDPHDVLGVPPGTSRAEVKQAYQTLAQIYHPDRYATASPRVREQAELRMQQVNAAYEQLTAQAGGDRVRPDGGSHGRSTRAEPAARPGRHTSPASRMDPKMRVKHVPGSHQVHRRGYVPFGIVSQGNGFTDSGRRCSRLDHEFTAWVRLPAVPDFLREMHWVIDTWAERRAARRLLEQASGLRNVRLHEIPDAELCRECFGDAATPD